MTERGAELDRDILAQAASWLLLLQEGPLEPAKQLEFERWRQCSSEHERAWKRAQRLLAQIESLPPALARPTLGRPVASSRRTLLRTLALLVGTAPLGWWLWRSSPWRGEDAADYLTAPGEQREVGLEDGTQVVLNTDTALDVEFSDALRLLRLRRGEIYISTGVERRAAPRPLLVQTEQGLLRALGTRFSVRQFDDETLLAVYEGAVQIRPGGASVEAAANIVGAGQQVRFSAQRIGPREPVGEAALAWRHGLLLADDMPLRQWAQELMRYGRETIVHDPALDDLRVSGTFPVNDLHLALSMLAQTYGLRVHDQGRQIVIGR